MRIIFLIIIMLSHATVFSQQREFFREDIVEKEDNCSYFENYSIYNGLSSNYINCITQDHYGYLWIGTAEGINKYNGYSFENFNNKTSDSCIVDDEYITAIAEDINGVIWVSSKKGINTYNHKLNTFVNDTINNYLKDKFVKALYADTLGNMWIDTYKGYLHQYNVLTGKLNVYKHDESKNTIYLMHKLWEENGKLWILHAGHTAIFDLKTKTFSYLKDVDFKNKNAGTFNGYHTCGLIDKHGNYYLNNTNRKTIVFNYNTKETSILPWGSIYFMENDSAGNLWLGGYGMGIVKYNIKENSITKYRHIDNNPNSIPNQQVFCMYIDKNKNMWFGTKNGLAKYNKYNNQIKNIKHIANLKNTPVSNNIKDIIETKDGKIWIATYSGLDCYNPKTGEFLHYKHNPDNTNSLLSNRVKTLHEDKYGDLWIGYWAGLGFDIFNRKNNIFKHYKYNKTPVLSGYDWYIGFAETKYDDFYAIMWGGNSSIFDKNNGEFTSSNLHPYPFHQNKPVKEILFTDNKLWNNINYFDYSIKQYIIYDSDYIITRYKNMPYFISRSNGNIINDYNYRELFNLHFKINKAHYFSTSEGIFEYNKKTNNFNKILKGYDVKYICNTNNENLLFVATIDNLYLFDKKLRKIIHNYNLSDTLKSISITNLLYTDKALLIGTNKGLFELKFNQSLLTDYAFFYASNKFKNINIIDLTVDDNNNLWIASNNGLVKINSSKTDTLFYNEENNLIPNNSINDIHIDKYGTLWVASLYGLYKYNNNSDSFTIYSHNPETPNSIPHNSVYKLTSDNTDSLFIATERGYCLYIISKNKFILYDEADNKTLQGSLSTCVFTDSKGFIWVGNEHAANSVDRINPETKFIEHFVDRSYDSSSYKGNSTFFIYEDNYNTIWIGTDKGLNKFIDKEHGFKLYNKQTGLPANNIIGMLQDNSDNYWLVTKKELIKWNIQENTFKIYNSNHYKHIGEYEKNVFCKSKSGDFYFGGNNGITCFNPDSLINSNKPANIAFTHLFVNDSVHTYQLEDNETINLSYNQNNINIGFTCFDFIKNNIIEYKYKLEGFDNKWIDADYNNRKIKYTSLPFGKYTLLLKATNEDGVWNETPLKLHINITQPWWERTWALLLFVSLFILMMYVLFKLRFRALNKRKEFLENEIKQRSQEIIDKNEKISEQKAADLIKKLKLHSVSEQLSVQENERNRIAQELHDSVGGALTGIKLFLSNNLKDNNIPELKIVSRDIDKIYQEVRAISHDLKPPVFEDQSIKEIIQNYITELKQRSKIEITSIFHPKTWLVLNENLQVQIYRIVQELFTNIIKHAKASEVEIQFIQHKNYINILIEDNGIGFNNKTGASGLGLSNIKNRIKLRNGNIQIDTSPGRGTVINIEIPYEI